MSVPHLYFVLLTTATCYGNGNYAFDRKAGKYALGANLYSSTNTLEKCKVNVYCSVISVSSKCLRHGIKLGCG